MKKHLLYTVGLVIALLTLSSFTDGPDYTNTYMNGHEYVDLGLPSGTMWATCNVGASQPEEFGGYYAWGETEEKDDYCLETYKWCEGDEYSMTKYCTDSYYGKIDNRTQLAPADDVAHVKWGGTWRMPTLYEQKELLNNCTWKWTTQNGVNGYEVTGPNGNSIFLPAAGGRYGTGLNDSGSYGNYWSSSLCGGSSYYAYGLNIISSYYDWNDYYYYGRCHGLSVRPVCGGTISKQSVNRDKLTGEQAAEEQPSKKKRPKEDIVVVVEEVNPLVIEKKVVPPPPQAKTIVDVIKVVEDEVEIEEQEIASVQDMSEYADVEDLGDFKYVEEEVIYDVAEDPAMFPGGDAALMNFIRNNLKYPRISRDNGSQGRAIVRFVVNTDGSIQNIEVIKSTGDMYLDKEAVRLVEIMPKWTPARQSGKPVCVKYVLPVSFRLQ